MLCSVGLGFKMVKPLGYGPCVPLIMWVSTVTSLVASVAKISQNKMDYVRLLSEEEDNITTIYFVWLKRMIMII